MNELLQRWLMLILPLRLLWLMMLSLLLFALMWFLLLRPQQQMREAQERQLEQMRQQQQQRLQQLASRPTIDALQSEISLLQQPTNGEGNQQTLERIVAARGNQLEAWHPDSQPQQLQLRLIWPQFLPLFSELAITRLPVPQRFQLQAEQGVLNTQFWLESDDAE
ncbi:HofO family protein [Pantoea agglomerans]